MYNFVNSIPGSPIVDSLSTLCLYSVSAGLAMDISLEGTREFSDRRLPVEDVVVRTSGWTVPTRSEHVCLSNIMTWSSVDLGIQTELFLPRRGMYVWYFPKRWIVYGRPVLVGVHMCQCSRKWPEANDKHMILHVVELKRNRFDVFFFQNYIMQWMSHVLGKRCRCRC